MKTLRYLLPLTFLMLLLVLLWQSLGHDKTEQANDMVGRPMPALSLTDLTTESEIVNGPDLIGKPMLINIWATWCVTCIAEHPFLVKLMENTDIQLVGLNYRDDRATAVQWLQQHGNPYKKVLFDPQGKAAVDFGIYGTPETFLIDAKGIIRYRYAGMLTPEIWEHEIAPVIERYRT